MQKNCKYCNKDFNARRNHIQYCSISCSLRNRPKRVYLRINLSCDYCGIKFDKQPNKVRNYNFCSRKCKDKAGRVEGGDKFNLMRPKHYGKSLNYRTRALRIYENKCCKCGYNKYTDVLEVHHIDNNHKNNKIENLEIVCPTCHVEAHFLSKTGKYKIKNESEV